MPAFLERKLKAQYGEDSNLPYKIMNAMGAMHGNKETAKGRAMARKHAKRRKARKHSENFDRLQRMAMEG